MDETAWHNTHFWVSPFNYVPEVRAMLALPKRLRFHDVTLRDGEQTPGVVFLPEEKLRIARQLDAVGVDRIEVAMPAVSADDERAVRMTVEADLRADILVFCRARRDDIDLAAACGVDGIILEFPCGEPRMRHQFASWGEEKVIALAADSARYAKDKGLDVIMFPLDATRAQPAFFFRLMEEAGTIPEMDAVTLVDTTGRLTPQAAGWLTGRMKAVTGKPIEIHTHSDFGMGVAVSLAAVAAGAGVVHASVAGLGERCGNTALEEAAVAARALYGLESGIDIPRLPELAAMVQELSGFPLAPNKPVVGTRCFTRESGLGVNMVKDEPMVLFGLNPAFVGREAEYVLGKKSGAASITMKLEDLGLPPADEARQAELLQAVKALGIRKKGLVTDEEFRAIATGTAGA